ncbi:hypothetical protein GIW54_21955 [Pseudomonas proteolytica]|uniref:Uncharacterized protein n=1 Tax=Pseudomonas proteolytica TaxID=219574 RepID=A0AAW5AC86_9PSED|nr:hypothetical protein [Pseudomonas proteolytica]MCF5057468.1 hypothetical protein [Pseudomonas proteolytica]MCF5103382.1 hypothetical protein [Pseudomonas proteolytica]
MSIDWSTAPDWAKELALNPYDEQAWLGDDGYSYLMGNGGIVSWTYETAYDRSAFKIMQIRPRPSVWTGEGLPPVGTVCEIRGTVGQELRKQPSEWTEVEIIAHTDFGGSPIAVGRHISGATLGWGTSNVFRPIRTPEQIAADEREKAVFEIAHILIDNRHDSAEYHQAGRIYDAGFRKQPSP